MRASLWRFWELMVVESKRASGTNEDAVTREGYMMMHVRVAKALHTDFDYAQAHDVAAGDWASDIINFSGDAAENVWLEEVKKKFRAGANRYGWQGLFNDMDSDGNGELDRDEFSAAVRSVAKARSLSVSDGQISAVFTAVDTDRSGSIDAQELAAALEGDAIDLDLRLALMGAAEEFGLRRLFDEMDEDGNGELDISEFIKAVRSCDINERVVPDDDVERMFEIVDEDKSGAIDATELVAIVQGDPLAQDMTFEVFFGSMFELVYLWVDTESEEQYCRFIDQIFEQITAVSRDGDGYIPSDSAGNARPLRLRDVYISEEEEEVEAATADGAAITKVRKQVYKLANIEEIESFADATGRIVIEGVDLTAELALPEPQAMLELGPEPEPEPRPGPRAEQGPEREPADPKPQPVFAPLPSHAEVRTRAATKMQAAERGRQARIHGEILRKQQQQNRAATQLQAVHRGRSERARVAEARRHVEEVMVEEAMRETEAASDAVLVPVPVAETETGPETQTKTETETETATRVARVKAADEVPAPEPEVVRAMPPEQIRLPIPPETPPPPALSRSRRPVNLSKEVVAKVCFFLCLLCLASSPPRRPTHFFPTHSYCVSFSVR